MIITAVIIESMLRTRDGSLVSMIKYDIKSGKGIFQKSLNVVISLASQAFMLTSFFLGGIFMFLIASSFYILLMEGYYALDSTVILILLLSTLLLTVLGTFSVSIGISFLLFREPMEYRDYDLKFVWCVK